MPAKSMQEGAQACEKQGWHWKLSTSHGIQIVLWMLSFVWLIVDPFAERLASTFLGSLHAVSPLELASQAVSIAGGTRTVAFGLGMLAVVVGLVFEFGQLCLRRGRPATIRQLLFLMAAIAMWCALIRGYEEVAWQGKRLRSNSRVQALDRLALSLHQDWPTDDGELEGLGPFTAYPFSQPSVILLLTPYPLAGTNTVVAAVERSPEGGLRFQLGGDDGGDWLEWHADGSLPRSFTGGLANEHHLRKYVRLSDDWFLVRYEQRL